MSTRARPYLETTVQSAAHHDALHELPKLTAVRAGGLSDVDHPDDLSRSAGQLADRASVWRHRRRSRRTVATCSMVPVRRRRRQGRRAEVRVGGIRGLFEGGDEDDHCSSRSGGGGIR
jgi:hypothetical protein